MDRSLRGARLFVGLYTPVGPVSAALKNDMAEVSKYGNRLTSDITVLHVTPSDDNKD